VLFVLGASDPVPFRPHRVLVAGSSGVGKTTAAGRIADVLGLPHTEIDSLFHGPGWVPRPSFEADVDALVAGERWVAEWQYRVVRARLAARADLLVWLDLPFAITLQRLVRRTVRRRVRREVLWNGNVEGPLRGVLTDPDHILRYAVRHRRKYSEQVSAVLAATPGLTGVRLASPREVETWLRRLARDDTQPAGP
jgi:hypothetical protein